MRSRIAACTCSAASSAPEPGPKTVRAAGADPAVARGESREMRVVVVGSWMPVLVFAVLSVMVSVLLGTVIIFNGRISAQAWDYLKILGPQIFTLWLASGYHYTGVPPQPPSSKP